MGSAVTWSTGLCSWCGGQDGLVTCLLSCFVPCAQHGINAEKLAPGEALCAGSCTNACLAWTGLYCLGVPCILQMSTRTAIRRKFNIQGSECGDFCTSCWCGPCDLCQQYYQLTSRKPEVAMVAHPPAGNGKVEHPPQPYAPPPHAAAGYPVPPPNVSYPPHPQAYPPAQQAYPPHPQAYPAPPQH